MSGALDLRVLGVDPDDGTARAAARVVYDALEREGYDVDGVAPVDRRGGPGGRYRCSACGRRHDGGHDCPVQPRPA